MRAVTAFAVTALVLIGVAALIVGRFFPAPDDIEAIWISGVVAFGVQLLTFALLKLAGPANVIAAWGVGMAVRLVALLLYMLLIVSAFGLSENAPLFLAIFLFVTSVVEPLLLPL